MKDAAPVRRAPNVVWQSLAAEEGAVLLNLDTGAYHGLNPVGERVWQLLESPRTPAELIALLAEEFDVEREVLSTDVEAFVSGLSSRKLVERDIPS